MAAPSKKFFGAGLASVRIYACDATTGLPAATSPITPYDGVLIGGPMSVVLEGVVPDPDIIAHPGNDRVLQYASFPGTAPATGTLTVSRSDLDTLAMLAATNVFTEAEINSVGWGTSSAGSEISVWLVVYQEGYSSGIDTFGTYVFKCKMYAKPRSMVGRDRADITYTLSPIIVSSEITGRTLTTGVDRELTETMREYESNNRVHFSFFLGNATSSSFNLAASYNAASTANMAVYVAGTAVTAGGFTALTISNIHLTTAPANNALVAVKYGLVSTAVDVD